MSYMVYHSHLNFSHFFMSVCVATFHRTIAVYFISVHCLFIIYLLLWIFFFLQQRLFSKAILPTIFAPKNSFGKKPWRSKRLMFGSWLFPLNSNVITTLFLWWFYFTKWFISNVTHISLLRLNQTHPFQ